MAIAYVGGASNGSASIVLTISVTYAPIAGNEVCVFLSTSGSTTGVTVKDSTGATLTAGPTVTNTDIIYSFYEVAPASVTSFTATWTGASANAIVVVEYSGVNSVRGIFSGDTNTGTSNAPSITSITNVSSSWLIAGLFAASTTSWAATSGNLRANRTGSFGTAVIDNTLVGSGSITCTATSSTSNKWGAVSIQLNPAASTSIHELLLLGAGI
jgi:hypothetical protein